MDKDELLRSIRQELADLLNDSQTKTSDKAQHVASLLLRKGVQPTWRLIREVLGTGSATTLQNVVNNYWSEIGKRLDHLEKRPNIPETLAEEFNALWDQALQQARNTLEAELETAFQEAKKIAKEADEQRQQLQAEYDQRLTEKETHIHAYQTQNKQLTKQAQELQSQLKTTGIQQQQAEKRCEQLQIHADQSHQRAEHLEHTQIENATRQQQALANLKTEQQALLDRQAKQYESMIDHYGQELGRLKGALESTEKSTQKERRDWQRKQQEQNTQLTQLQIENARLQQENQQLNSSHKNLQQRVDTQMENIRQLETSHARLQTRCELYEEQNIELKQQLKAETKAGGVKT